MVKTSELQNFKVIHRLPLITFTMMKCQSSIFSEWDFILISGDNTFILKASHCNQSVLGDMKKPVVSFIVGSL